MILTNLIPVPSMTSGWSVSGTTAVTGYGGGSSIKLTGTTSTPEVLTNTAASIALIPSHIYYARVYGYQTTKAGGSVGFYWPIAEPSFQESISLKDAGSWQMYSGRNNRTSFSSGNYQFRLDYNNNYIAGTMYFSAPMLIDLTVAFGSGNEPTKEWCDQNLTFFNCAEGGAPSVETSSRIKTVGSNINLFDPNNHIEFDGKYRVYSTGNTVSASSFFGLKIPVLGNVEYSVSSNLARNQYFQLCYYDKDFNFMWGEIFMSGNTFRTPNKC